MVVGCFPPRGIRRLFFVTQETPLTEAFGRALPLGLDDRFPHGAELDASLSQLLGAARQSWPSLDVDDALFVEHLAGRLNKDSVLNGLHAADLYVAFSCSLGDPAAMQALERDVLPQVPSVLKGNLPAGMTQDDVMQALRLKLFLRQPEAPPAISTYSGRGALLHWMRAAALRVTQDFARARKLEIATPDEAMLDTPAVNEDADVVYLKNQYAPEFKAAFQEAMASLSQRDQSLLRLQYLDGMSAEEIGRIYQTHRTTIWRWLTGCREELLKKTRKLLAERLKVSESEFSSLMNAMQSDLDVSLSRILRKA